MSDRVAFEWGFPTCPICGSPCNRITFDDVGDAHFHCVQDPRHAESESA